MKFVRDFLPDDYYSVADKVDDAISALYRVYDDVANPNAAEMIDDFMASVLLVMKDEIKETSGF